MKELYAMPALRMAGKILEAAANVKNKDGAMLIFLHRSVDGDCVGSACGMCSVLRTLGVNCYVAMPEMLPADMSFMGIEDLLLNLYDESNGLMAELRANGRIYGKPYVQALSVDISESNRMGTCGEFFDMAEDKLIIDHHASITMRADNMWIEPDASSAAELCFYVTAKIAELKGIALDMVLTPIAAQCFMTGLVTDTGRFTYKNTKPETLESAGVLMQHGGDITSVSYNLFDRKALYKFRVSAEARMRVKIYADGKLAITTVPRALFDKHEALPDAVDDVVSAMRDIEGVETAIVLRELSTGEIRANVRSVSTFDSAAFAALYGGGGHIRAAGFTVKDYEGGIEDLAEDVIKKASELL
ncbi:MAG: DHH family phosphoesterase [Saccharofermentans sp.]|nr:DHH family phosphoesterase [Saccharofermentans sp.]